MCASTPLQPEHEEPMQPEAPTQPEEPTQLEAPMQPEEPTQPEKPMQPEEPSSNKSYSDWDISIMSSCLEYFFPDKEQRQAAKDVYKAAVETPGTSPIAAFEQAARSSALVPELDARYPDQGGVYYYLHGKLRSKLQPPTRASFHFVQDFRNAISLRKTREIKKLMAAAEAEALAGQVEGMSLDPKYDIEIEVIYEVEVEIKSDEVKSDEVQPDEVKSDEVKSDEVKSDEVKSDEVKSDDEVTIKAGSPLGSPLEEEIRIKLVVKAEGKNEITEEIMGQIKKVIVEQIKDAVKYK